MHVKICVDCGEEYRPEVAVCADCGGRLEETSDDAPRAKPGPRPPEATEGEADLEGEAEFTDALAYTDRAGDLRADADRLVEAGIDFRIRPSQPTGYRLLVAAEDRERALAAIGMLVEPESADADVKSCPACGTALSGDAVDCPECGLQVGFQADEIICPRCGADKEGTVCRECGR